LSSKLFHHSIYQIVYFEIRYFHFLHLVDLMWLLILVEYFWLKLAVISIHSVPGHENIVLEWDQAHVTLSGNIIVHNKVLVETQFVPRQTHKTRTGKKHIMWTEFCFGPARQCGDRHLCAILTTYSMSPSHRSVARPPCF